MFSKLAVVFVSLAAIATATPALTASNVVPHSTPSTAVPAPTTTAVVSGQNTTDVCAFGDGGFHQGSGTPWCCKSIQDPRSPASQEELNAVQPAPPRDAKTIFNFMGVQCTPMEIPGSFDSGIKFPCEELPVCCRNNSFNGVVALGCTTMTLEFD